jgi:nitrite reductase/ring-hydroxylating ferredoxin subunit
MKKAGRLSRRRFLKVAGGISIAGLAVIWDQMVSSERELAAVKRVSLPFNPNSEFTFHPQLIIHNGQDGVKVFSSKCSHLGCVIQRAEEGKLVCPCHGSTFNVEGLPEKGPAVKPLEQLPFMLDQESKQITIEL